MKSSTILAIGVSLISIAFAISIASSTEGLVIAWSNYGVFNGVNLQEVADVDCNQISRAVAHKDSGLKKYIGASNTIPEILVVFVQPNLGAREFPVLAQAYSTLPSGGAFHKLKEYLETSSSSLSLTNAHDSRNQMSENFPQYLKRDFNIDTIVSAGHEQSMSIEQLLEKLNGNWNLLSNGKNDLVVVKFNSPSLLKLSGSADVAESYARDDASMGKIIAAIESKQVAYIGFFVGEESRVQSTGRIEQEQMRIFKDSFSQSGGYTTNWTSEINEGLLVSLPVFIVIGIAIRCAFGLQSSLSFEAEKKILKGIRQ